MLVSLQFEFAGSREHADMYGDKPLGYLILTQDQRLMTIITSQRRPSPNGDADEAALFKTMMAYSGVYRVEGDQFITNVDVSWHPAWVGTEQARFFALEGKTLSVITAQIAHPMFPGRTGRGVLKWCRVEPHADP